LHDLVALTITPDTLTFQFPGGQRASYPHPKCLLYADDGLPWHDIGETAAGELNVHTLLIAPNGQPWLTDLQHTPVMPTGYKLARLENSIRFDLLPADNIQTLWDFETQLARAVQTGNTLHPGDVEPPYRKALSLIQDLRYAAQHQHNSLTVYQSHLFLGALAQLHTYRPDWRYTRAEIAHFLHAILCAALLGISLTQPSLPRAKPRTNTPPLRIDVPNRQVWIGNRQIPVSPTEFDLLHYLYQHAGQLCKREDIVRDVFDLPHSSKDDRASLINANIGRLRKKVELDTNTPRYITTVWGAGYILIVKPE